MRKVLTIVLAVILVMAMTVPAFAASTTPVESPYNGYQQPEIEGELPDGLTIYDVSEVDKLSKTQRDAFAEAQDALEDAKPDDMNAKYFFYVTGGSTGKDVQLKLDGVNEVVVKRYAAANDAWEDLEITRNGDVLTIKMKSGSIAVFTN